MCPLGYISLKSHRKGPKKESLLPHETHKIESPQGIFQNQSQTDPQFSKDSMVRKQQPSQLTKKQL